MTGWYSLLLRVGKNSDLIFWMGQCWVEVPFTLLKVLRGQVGAEAEHRC